LQGGRDASDTDCDLGKPKPVPEPLLDEITDHPLGFRAQHVKRRPGHPLVGCLFQVEEPDLRVVPVRDDQLVPFGDGRQAITRQPDVLG
jgi:hypothetical protein